MRQYSTGKYSTYIGKLLREHADAGATRADDEPVETRFDAEVARGLVLEPLREHFELLGGASHAVARAVDDHFAKLLSRDRRRLLLLRLLLVLLTAAGRLCVRGGRSGRHLHWLLADRYVAARLGADPLNCEKENKSM